MSAAYAPSLPRPRLGTDGLVPPRTETTGLPGRARARFKWASAQGALALLLLATILFGYRAYHAAGPGGPTTHPLVGTWTITNPFGGPHWPTQVQTFFADGNLLFNNGGTHTDQGTWEATGDRTATIATFGFVLDDHGSVIGIGRDAGTVEIDATGDTFRAEVDVVVTALDGTAMGSVHQIWKGTRVTTRPVGTPTPGTPAP